MAYEGRSLLEIAATTTQVLSVVVGVVISVLSFNASRDRDAEARISDAKKRCIEANKPLLALRQTLYSEAAANAAVLVNRLRPPEELATAKAKFRDLYVATLSMVEDKEVATAMVALAKTIDPELANFTGEQGLAYRLAQALGTSLNKEAKCEY